MNRTTFCVIFCILLLLLFPGRQSPAEPLDMGDSFPEIQLPAPQSAKQRAYLGLPDQQPFTLKQVTGKVVLVEMLNVLCPHCRKQTKPYNQLYRMIEADPETRGRIKMLGVAVANSPEQIEDFVDIYDVLFPVVADRSFKLHRALRAGPTPFSLYVLRDKPGGTSIIAGTQLGEDYKMDDLFSYLKEMLSMPISEFSVPREKTELVAEKLHPPQADGEIAQMIEQSFAAQGEQLSDFRRLELESGRWVYTATVTRNGKRQPLFAEVANRSAICDICHSVHFYYLFDRTGLILDFVPLHLTKYGNVEWNLLEVYNFRKRVIGKHLAGNWQFDPTIDAVTSATMTSAIIFDNFDQGRVLLEELQKEKLLGP
ncbi:TlpA disulfide reductase family protein [Malonomonas rubra]|uniref:TlpA family protein disulfide reductase n=1 Tax=Malonomonas rubra TaxID=57040 RepID=UPI0026EF235E|nr:TlpA disulfide reductase family protein [Malonomonas rubra]